MEKNNIDFVIAWVDGNDPVWQKEKRKWENEEIGSKLDRWNLDISRYRDWDTLKFWFRAVEEFAPWVRKIHFVTYGHFPDWLNTKNEKLHLVRHDQFIPECYLPTFSSHCIELNLHRIKDLSEYFVYFNDDMFLINTVSEKDFFYKGLPCDSAILNPVRMKQNGIRAEINDLYLINDHFDKKEVIKNNMNKWFNMKYGSGIIRTLLMMPFKEFDGFYIHHLPTSILKSTAEEVWNECFDELNETCLHKFRKVSDVNQWIFQYWQYCEGRFSPRTTRIGKMYEGLHEFDIMCDAIATQKYKMICCNDSIAIGEDIYNEKMRLLHASFLKILNKKSSFELW